MKKQRAPESHIRANWQQVMPAFVVSLCCLAVYWNSLQAPFVFDDLLSVTRNNGVRFALESWDLRQFLRPRSLLFLTFRFNNWFGELAVWHYHAVNLLLHIANSVLVLYIARHIFGRTLADSRLAKVYALLAACFFAVHPVQTESVTYISSRSELLSTFFYASAFLLFIKRSPERIGFLFSLMIGFLFLFGLGGKETVISLPGVLVLYDYLFIANLSVRSLVSRWRFYAPFAAGALAAVYYLLTTTLATAVGSASGSAEPLPYFLTQLSVMVRYIRILFVPTGLNLDYDFPIYTEWAHPAVLLSAGLLGLVVLAGWFLRRREPVVALSIFWFFITLAPTSSFVSILDVIFEHRLYLPLVGVALSFPLAVRALTDLAARFDFRLRTVQVATGILVVLGAAAILRNEVWRSEVTLWEDVISKSPRKARPYYALMFAHFGKRDYEKAVGVAQLARERIPDQMWQINNSLGNMYLQLGRYDEAARVFSDNVSGDPTGGLSSNNLGTAYRHMLADLERRRSSISQQEFETERQGLLSKAQDAFLDAVHRSPDNLDYFDAYINVAFEMGRAAELETGFREELTHGETFNPLYGIGKLAYLYGDHRTAVWYLERAAKLKSSRLLSFNIANSWSELGDFGNSIKWYQLTLQVDPLLLEAYYNLGSAYMRDHQLDSAIRQFDEVVRLNPNHILAHIMLAKIYIEKVERKAALEHLDKALTLSPGNQEAQALRNSLAGRS